MKTVKIITSLALILVSTLVFSQETKAKIVFVRSKSIAGWAAKYKILLDGKEQFRLKRGKYIETDIAEGKHEISVKVTGPDLSIGKHQILPIEVKSGEVYFVYFKPDVVSGQIKMAQLSQIEAEKYILKSKLQ